MTRQLVKCYMWVCLWGWFCKRLAFESVDLGKTGPPSPTWVSIIQSLRVQIEQNGRGLAILYLLELEVYVFLPLDIATSVFRIWDLNQSLTPIWSWTGTPLVPLVLQPLEDMTELHHHFPRACRLRTADNANF